MCVRLQSCCLSRYAQVHHFTVHPFKGELMSQASGNAKSNSPVVITLDQNNFLITEDGQPLYVYKTDNAPFDGEWPEETRALVQQWVPLPAPAVDASGKLQLGQRSRPADKTKRDYAQVTFGASELPLYTYTGGPENPLERQWDRAHVDMGGSSDSSGEGERGIGRNGP